MVLIKPINSFLKDNIDPATMSYLGTVEDNKDPKKMGRLRVRVSPYMDYETEDLPWACPTLGTHGNTPNAGGLNVPEIGAQVRVYFPSHDLTAPYYTGAELNEVNRTTFFDEDYPNTYGYKDSTGNFIKVNKAKDTIQLQHSSSSTMKVAPDGSMQISLSNGAYFTFSNQNAFDLNIGAVSVSGTPDGALNIKANMRIELEAPNIRLKAKTLNTEGYFSSNTGVSGNFWAYNHYIEVTDGLITLID